MRILITHEGVYPCEPRAPMLLLRMTPSRFDAQYVVRWRIECGDTCRLRAREDAFGNQTHIFSSDGPLERATINVWGEVETVDQAGVVRNAPERMPPAVFMRQTPATEPDGDIRAFAHDVAATETDPLGALHALMRALNQRLAPVEGEAPATIQEAFAQRIGTPRHHAHLMASTARSLGWPARVVSGYRMEDDGAETAHAMHEWAEVLVEGYGWIGFDSVNDLCPTDRYVRIAVGLDASGAAPIVGVRRGALSAVSLSVRAAEAMAQVQN